jgi:hypothetical protein
MPLTNIAKQKGNITNENRHLIRQIKIVVKRWQEMMEKCMNRNQIRITFALGKKYK